MELYLQLEGKEGHGLCSRSMPKGGARDWPATCCRELLPIQPRWCCAALREVDAYLSGIFGLTVDMPRQRVGCMDYLESISHLCQRIEAFNGSRRKDTQKVSSFCLDFRPQQSQSHVTVPPYAELGGWLQSLKTMFGDDLPVPHVQSTTGSRANTL